MVAYVQFYVDRWLGGTEGLSLEQEGAFIRWVAGYAARDGLFPDDISLLAKVWRCNARKAKRLRAQLLAKGKLYVEDGCLHQTFAKHCVNKAISKSEVSTNSAFKRWQNYRENNGGTHANACANADQSSMQTHMHGRGNHNKEKKASYLGESQQPPPVENPEATPPAPKPPHHATRAELEAAFTKRRGPFT